jgi:hypothetical protein
VIQLPPRVPTVGVIADKHNAKVHQVVHIIRSRGIQPSGRAGSAYVYSDADVAFVGHELRRIARAKGAGDGR